MVKDFFQTCKPKISTSFTPIFSNLKNPNSKTIQVTKPGLFFIPAYLLQVVKIKWWNLAALAELNPKYLPFIAYPSISWTKMTRGERSSSSCVSRKLDKILMGRISGNFTHKSFKRHCGILEFGPLKLMHSLKAILPLLVKWKVILAMWNNFSVHH